MLIKTYKQIPSNEITDPAVFRQRRTLLKAMAALAIGAAGSDTVAARSRTWPDLQTGNPPVPDLQPTPAELVGNYTNYYEFAFNKEDATRLAQRLRIDAWSVTIGGEVENPASYHLEDLLQRCPLREYLYRFRCVEGWSMVVPWVGFALSDLLKLAQPWRRPNSSNSPAPVSRRRCRGCGNKPCWPGPTKKACVSTKPAIR